MHIRKSRFSLNNEKSYVILVYAVKSLIYRPLFFTKKKNLKKTACQKLVAMVSSNLMDKDSLQKKLVPR